MSYQNYPQYPQPVVDPFAYEQMRQANQALQAENAILKDETLKKNWLNQQREFAREERSAVKREVAHRSGAEIISMGGKLCITSPVGRLYPLMNRAPLKIYFVIPDDLYQLEPYYVLLYQELQDPVILRLSTVENDRAFIHELIQATGESIAMTKSIKKIATLLHNYFDRNSIKIHLKFYAGWAIADKVLCYFQQHGSTHGQRGCLCDPIACEQQLERGNHFQQGVALTTTEKFADLMDVIPSYRLRSDISMVLHTAFLYGLLGHWGYRFPFGFSFYTQHAAAVSIMKSLLCWYQDGPISLLKHVDSLQDDLLERKDQPIVIDSVEGTHPNCKVVEEAIRTGCIFRKNTPDGIPLQGLVCITTQHISDLSFSGSIATMELDGKACRADGLSFMQPQLPYLQEYFLNLAAFITHHAVRLKEAFDMNMELFRSMDFGYLLPSAECVEAAGILYAIAELVHDYHMSLAPGEGLSARLSLLTDTDCAERMLVRFVEASCNTDEGSATVNQFSAFLQKAIDSRELIVIEKTFGEAITLPDSKANLLILEDEQNYMITAKAMDLLAKKMAVSSPQLLRSLAETGILVGARTNSTTYQTRTRVIASNGNHINIAVYRIDKQKLFDPTLYM